MTIKISCPKTYYVVCYVFLTDHLTMLSIDNYFTWLALEPNVLMNPTITTIFLN